MAITYEVTFGDRLRRARIALGLDQRQLAEGIDMNHTSISRYELQGGKDDAPTRRLAALMERRYGVSADWLLTGEVPAQRAGTGERWVAGESNSEPADYAPNRRHLILVRGSGAVTAPARPPLRLIQGVAA